MPTSIERSFVRVSRDRRIVRSARIDAQALIAAPVSQPMRRAVAVDGSDVFGEGRKGQKHLTVAGFTQIKDVRRRSH
jgi:hypothetical protein